VTDETETKKDLGDRSCGIDFEADIWDGRVHIVTR
jgi:hypothetical protein